MAQRTLTILSDVLILIKGEVQVIEATGLDVFHGFFSVLFAERGE